jgi:hypothetical protein
LTASAARADIVTVVDGWTVVYHITGEPTTHFFGDGTYLFLLLGSAGYGTVYVHQTNWVFLGYLGDVTLPEGFPQISFDLGGADTQVAIVPPPVSSCGSPSPSEVENEGRFVVTVGGLPANREVIGPFLSAERAARFANRRCMGSWSIDPMRPRK